jgi:hypothetical protein
MEAVVVVAVVANNDDFEVQSLVVVVVAWRAPCHTVAALLQRRISDLSSRSGALWCPPAEAGNEEKLLLEKRGTDLSSDL